MKRKILAFIATLGLALGAMVGINAPTASAQAGAWVDQYPGYVNYNSFWVEGSTCVYHINREINHININRYGPGTCPQTSRLYGWLDPNGLMVVRKGQLGVYPTTICLSGSSISPSHGFTRGHNSGQSMLHHYYSWGSGTGRVDRFQFWTNPYNQPRYLSGTMTLQGTEWSGVAFVYANGHEPTCGNVYGSQTAGQSTILHLN